MRTPATLLLLLGFSLPAAAQISAGDAAWARRSEGSRGTVAAAGPVNQAVAAYERAVAAEPRNLEARWKLLRALRFSGAYVAQTPDQKKAVYSRARAAGDDAMEILASLLPRGLTLESRDSERVAALLRAHAGSAELLVWDAVAWGEWALVYGKMAAVRQGAADRIRRSATLAMLIDPAAERGGGARVLGRLHHQTPRVPFVTGWASDIEAVRVLREALRSDPSDRLTKVFLAEALADTGGESGRREARKLASEASVGAPDPRFLVEETDAIEQARALGQRLRG